jgi:hypothetical protein
MGAPRQIKYHGQLYVRAARPDMGIGLHDDPADIAAHILEQGEHSDPLAVIKTEWDALLRKIAQVKQENAGLQHAGAGNTEAAHLVGMKVLPQLERMIKVAQAVVTQLKPLMKRHDQ